MRNKKGGRKLSVRLFFFLPALSVTVLFIGLIFLFRKGKWYGQDRFTVVINASPVAVFTIEPKLKGGLLVTFPANTILDIPYGYGEYIASAVLKLGDLDKGKGGGFLLEKSIEKTLGISVDGYFSSSSDDWGLPVKDNGDIKRLKGNDFSFPNLRDIFLIISGSFGHYRTDLSIADRFKLWNNIRKLRSDQVSLIKMEDRDILIADNLPDRTPVYRIDPDRLNSVLEDNFLDHGIRSENLSLQIINATGENLIAREFGRILTSRGANVILKTTSEKSAKDACVIYLTQEKFGSSKIVSFLVKHFRCRISKYQNDEGKNQTDIQIVLGGDFLK